MRTIILALATLACTEAAALGPAPEPVAQLQAVAKSAVISRDNVLGGGAFPRGASVFFAGAQLSSVDVRCEYAQTSQSARTLAQFGRNETDPQCLAVSASGGVVVVLNTRLPIEGWTFFATLTPKG